MKVRGINLTNYIISFSFYAGFLLILVVDQNFPNFLNCIPCIISKTDFNLPFGLMVFLIKGDEKKYKKPITTFLEIHFSFPIKEHLKFKLNFTMTFGNSIDITF
ncbi:hypothetical protein ACJX0J_025636 [Zea mays]